MDNCPSCEALGLCGSCAAALSAQADYYEESPHA